MYNFRVLDCTLRDGGCVNDFNFGDDYIYQIKNGLEQSGVDIIELGYIDDKAGSESGRTQYINEKVIEKYIGEKKNNIMYVAMMDYGKFDPNNFGSRTETGIDGIRIAFHKKNCYDAVQVAKIISSKGYRVFLQPMLILRYTDEELLKLIQHVNTELPDAEAFYIVDSFGEMRNHDLERLSYLIHHNLSRSISLGLHSHNNLQLSYSNAIHLIEKNFDRKIIIDASIMGMGKGAGNLTTELLFDHSNLYYGKNYLVTPLLNIIDNVLNQIYADFKWGYSVEYYLSASNSCTPSYAKYFFSKHLLSISEIGNLLSQIPPEKQISYDKKFAEELFFSYNHCVYDDTANVNKIQSAIKGKKILLIGPGRSITKHTEKISKFLSDPSIVSIGLNLVDLFKMDFVYTNKSWVHEGAIHNGFTPIVLSNMGFAQKTDLVLQHDRWSKRNDELLDSSFEVVLNLLETLGAKEIYLAGFDGFEIDTNLNYYKEGMRRSLTKEDVSRMNQKVLDTIKKYREIVKIEFITPTKYEGQND